MLSFYVKNTCDTLVLFYRKSSIFALKIFLNSFDIGGKAVYSLVDLAHKMAEPRINCYKDIFGIKMISILCTLTYPKSSENFLLIIY